MIQLRALPIHWKLPSALSSLPRALEHLLSIRRPRPTTNRYFPRAGRSTVYYRSVLLVVGPARSLPEKRLASQRAFIDAIRATYPVDRTYRTFALIACHSCAKGAMRIEP